VRPTASAADLASARQELEEKLMRDALRINSQHQAGGQGARRFRVTFIG
jgi:hypothetical protein